MSMLPDTLSEAGTGVMLAASVALKGAAILLLTALLVRLARGASAALRHLLWSAALCALLALPLLTRLTPAWTVALLPASNGTQPALAFSNESLGAGGDAGAGQRGTVAAARTTGAPSRAGTGDATAVAGSMLNRVVTHSSTDAGDDLRPRSFAWRLPPGDVLLLGWAVGAALLLLPLLLVTLRVRRYAASAPAVRSPAVLAQVQAVRAALRVRGPVRVIEGPRGAMPMTWGVIRPVVLLPAGADQWPRPRLLAVLRHELAHVARHDALTQLFGELACALHWFDPLVWVAVRRQRIEREHACDDLVLASGSRPFRLCRRADGPGALDAHHALRIARGHGHGQAARSP